MTDMLISARNLAIEIASEASQMVIPYWPNMLNGQYDPYLANETYAKPGIANIAMFIDQETERMITERIKGVAAFANHTIFGEENGKQVGSSDFTWIIDPIDGTMNFSVGREDFGVSIGVVEGTEPVVGVIAVPAKGLIFAAAKGHGVQLLRTDGTQIKELSPFSESSQKALKDSFISYDVAYENRSEQLKRLVAPLSERVRYMHSICSSSVSVTEILMGQFDAFFSEEATIMDLAAAAAIIRELGGKATTMTGDEFDWTKGKQSFLATRDTKTHQELIASFTGKTH